MFFTLEAMQKYIGVTDIVIISALLIALIIGACVGFFKIALRIANTVCGFFFSLVFAERFSKIIGLFLKKPIYNHFYDKVYGSKAMSGIDEAGNTQEEMAKFLKGYGLPKFLSNFIADRYKGSSTLSIKESICNTMASGITKVILTVIAFFILWFGLSIIFFILRKTIDGLRRNSGFRLFDGIAGTILTIIIWFAACEIGMYVVTLMKSGNVYSVFVRDLRLDTYKGMGIGRWFYNKNLVKAFMDMFF